MHARHHTPNQDSYGRLSPLDSPTLTAAVADGHGSPEYVRSKQGSRFAVETALDAINRLPTAKEKQGLTRVKRYALELLPRSISNEWARRVAEHFALNPFTPAETALVEDQAGAQRLERLLRNPLRAYGTTLLACTITPTYALYYKLGDGALLALDAFHEAFTPVPHDERLVGNQTTSLCAPESWRDAKVTFHPRVEQCPVFVLLCTDGFANAYPDDDSLAGAARNLLEDLATHGHDALQCELPAILDEVSLTCTGDDSTLALLYNHPHVRTLSKCEKGASHDSNPRSEHGSQNLPLWAHVPY